MFESALKAGLPVIGVTTDDPVNFETVLRHLSGSQVTRLTKTNKPKSWGKYLYWTDDQEIVTADLYESLKDADHQLIVILKSAPSSVIFDAGIMPTPEPLMRELLKEVVGEEWVEELYPAMKGLSLKAAQEILLFTQARTGNTSVSEIRRSRAMVSGMQAGLTTEDTSFDFYLWPPRLRKWMDVNKEYFAGDVHPKLIPRGVMVEGAPGTGKSMAAKAIARELKLPLYRVDIASALDKYIGESERKLNAILSLVDREAPCVVLVDEVEKVFKSGADGAVISRLMSQLLWWLSEHPTRVYVVMTTNDRSGIPPELYRTGRLDLVLTISKLTWTEAKVFAKKVFVSVLKKEPTSEQNQTIWSAMEAMVPNGAYVDGGPVLAHAEVAELIYEQIKLFKWDLTKPT